METATETRFKNHILSNLDKNSLQMVSAKLKKIDMVLGNVIYHQNQKIENIYFPETSVISIVTLLENGTGVESGIIGREGLSGTAVILTNKYAFSEATVQLSGEAYEMKVKDFKQVFEEDEKFKSLIYSYLHSFISQISQNAACLCHHTIEKRLARWLLMFNDRSQKLEMYMTQEFIAQMLGVHRPSVSKSANKLQKLGLIDYKRGLIKILDRESLEKFSCECYVTINNTLNKYINFDL